MMTKKIAGNILLALVLVGLIIYVGEKTFAVKDAENRAEILEDQLGHYKDLYEAQREAYLDLKEWIDLHNFTPKPVVR